MLERTFTAPQLDQALARVKRELGVDAVILSSRRVEGAGVEIRAAAAPHAVAPTRPLGLLERLLVRNGLEAHVAAELAAAAQSEPRTLRDATEALAHALEARARFSSPGRDRRGAVAFVGPTGAGKTTTLAKVAAQAALIERRRVGIVSLDNYRIGAAAQLEQYAELIGVPLLFASDRAAFTRAFDRLADADLVLIDTAGRSPRDPDALVRTAETLRAVPGIRVCLCLCAAMRSIELRDAVARHAVLGAEHLTVTKLDEALQHDGVLEAQRASGLALAWLTAGQRVPEDIEQATPAKLASVLLGEEGYR